MSSLLLTCSHTSWLKFWCIDLVDQWFLGHPVWCHCTFHQCNSSGTLRLLGCQWRPWTHFPGVSSHHPFWISRDVAITWSLRCPGNLQCWQTIFLGEYWMLPMWGWCDSATPEMLSAGPLKASGMWAVGIQAVLPLCWKKTKMQWSWKKFMYDLILMQFATQWSWKKLPCTKLWITLGIMVGFGWNFETIWMPIRVTSDVNCSCLPALLWELSWIVCVFNTLPDLLTWVHNGHNRHNEIWKFEF